ncbi:PREDICTED: uncharacterized protein LOC108362572 [Rhagoletis zephyria]|uniref:uncharacterized protein LOC108362572 n=1 Tax=Rhagoletis zephyria TaxID=28612 RepID=UPI000811A85D|nr:PREDICTED: uncharacterized protein LOC108362572 [Rhagoletis zephyria]
MSLCPNISNSVTCNLCFDFEPQPVCYIPHHGVYKGSSSTTKLRTVFNASRKMKCGRSLNDCLLVGPKLQNDLSAIILNWRWHKIAFTADIEKCFRQILVDHKDADMQRIFWKDEHGQPCLYRLLTVTYGLNCSPYLTIKVLHTLAKDEGTEFPEAADVLKECFYVDDCLSGASSVDKAVELQQQLQILLQRGGFTLRKWNSNSGDFLQKIQGTNANKICALDSDQDTKALGIYWSCQDDYIGYKVKVSVVSVAITKRQQLSDVAKIYDPACLLAPIIITGKRMCQDLWRTGCTWDDPIPEPYQSEWIKFRDEMPLMENVEIPRWLFTADDIEEAQLHVFCDASSAAFAAVAYLRVTQLNGEIKVSIIMAKTKVAPLKKRTIPCLELNGAVLASTLTCKILETLQLKSTHTWYWCDSKTVISWIRSNPGQHKQYVANRIAKIQEMTNVDAWRYVPTKCNPADVASRGIYPSQLEDLSIWWAGPTWLQKDESYWPASIVIEPTSTQAAGNDDLSIVSLISVPKPDDWILQKYSCIQKLLAVTAWCLRFSAVEATPAPTSSINIAVLEPEQQQFHRYYMVCSCSGSRTAIRLWPSIGFEI